jgi:hypothetical protein
MNVWQKHRKEIEQELYSLMLPSYCYFSVGAAIWLIVVESGRAAHGFSLFSLNPSSMDSKGTMACMYVNFDSLTNNAWLWTSHREQP